MMMNTSMFFKAQSFARPADGSARISGYRKIEEQGDLFGALVHRRINTDSNLYLGPDLFPLTLPDIDVLDIDDDGANQRSSIFYSSTDHIRRRDYSSDKCSSKKDGNTYVQSNSEKIQSSRLRSLVTESNIRRCNYLAYFSMATKEEFSAEINAQTILIKESTFVRSCLMALQGVSSDLFRCDQLPPVNVSVAGFSQSAVYKFILHYRAFFMIRQLLNAAVAAFTEFSIDSAQTACAGGISIVLNLIDTSLKAMVSTVCGGAISSDAIRDEALNNITVVHELVFLHREVTMQLLLLICPNTFPTELNAYSNYCSSSSSAGETYSHESNVIGHFLLPNTWIMKFSDGAKSGWDLLHDLCGKIDLLQRSVLLHTTRSIFNEPFFVNDKELHLLESSESDNTHSPEFDASEARFIVSSFVLHQTFIPVLQKVQDELFHLSALDGVNDISRDDIDESLAISIDALYDSTGEISASTCIEFLLGCTVWARSRIAILHTMDMTCTSSSTVPVKRSPASYSSTITLADMRRADDVDVAVRREIIEDFRAQYTNLVLPLTSGHHEQLNQLVTLSSTLLNNYIILVEQKIDSWINPTKLVTAKVYNDLVSDESPAIIASPSNEASTSSKDDQLPSDSHVVNISSNAGEQRHETTDKQLDADDNLIAAAKERIRQKYEELLAAAERRKALAVWRNRRHIVMADSRRRIIDLREQDMNHLMQLQVLRGKYPEKYDECVRKSLHHRSSPASTNDFKPSNAESTFDELFRRIDEKVKASQQNMRSSVRITTASGGVSNVDLSDSVLAIPYEKLPFGGGTRVREAPGGHDQLNTSLQVDEDQQRWERPSVRVTQQPGGISHFDILRQDENNDNTLKTIHTSVKIQQSPGGTSKIDLIGGSDSVDESRTLIKVRQSPGGASTINLTNDWNDLHGIPVVKGYRVNQDPGGFSTVDLTDNPTIEGESSNHESSSIKVTQAPGGDSVMASTLQQLETVAITSKKMEQIMIVGTETAVKHDVATVSENDSGLLRTSIRVNQHPGGDSSLSFSNGQETNNRSSIRVNQAAGGSSNLSLAHQGAERNDEQPTTGELRNELKTTDGITKSDDSGEEQAVILTEPDKRIELPARTEYMKLAEGLIEPNLQFFHESDSHHELLLELQSSIDALTTSCTCLETGNAATTEDKVSTEMLQPMYSKFMDNLGFAVLQQCRALNVAALRVLLGGNAQLLHHIKNVNSVLLVTPSSDFIVLLVSSVVMNRSHLSANQRKRRHLVSEQYASCLWNDIDVNSAVSVALQQSVCTRNEAQRLKEIVQFKFGDAKYNDQETILWTYEYYKQRVSSSTHCDDSTPLQELADIWSIDKLDLLTCHYAVPWPLNVVITDSMLDKLIAMTRRFIEITQLSTLFRYVWSTLRENRRQLRYRSSTLHSRCERLVTSSLHSVQVIVQALFDYFSSCVAVLQQRFNERITHSAKHGLDWFIAAVSEYAQGLSHAALHMSIEDIQILGNITGPGSVMHNSANEKRLNSESEMGGTQIGNEGEINLKFTTDCLLQICRCIVHAVHLTWGRLLLEDMERQQYDSFKRHLDQLLSSLHQQRDNLLHHAQQLRRHGYSSWNIEILLLCFEMKS